EPGVLDQGWSRVLTRAAGQERRDCQEELVDETVRHKRAEHGRSALAKDQPVTTASQHLDSGERFERAGTADWDDRGRAGQAAAEPRCALLARQDERALAQSGMVRVDSAAAAEDGEGRPGRAAEPSAQLG